MIAEIVRLTTQNKHHVLFLVHRRELIEQIRGTLESNDCDMNYVTLGMVMTVVRRLDDYPPFDLIVVDENHHVLANSYRKILDHFNTRVIGFTATPVRLNGDGLGDINDILLEEVNVPWLIENNRLAPFKCFIPNLIDRSKLKLNSVKEFSNQSIDDALGTTIFGDVIEHYNRLAPGTRTIVYCHSIEFSKMTADRFNEEGITARHIDAKTPKQERDAIIQAFRDGEITVLTNVDLIGEGFDVPDCSTVILLRPTASLSLHIQQSMRSMRYKPNKQAVIIDHVGNSIVHGLPDEVREWELNPPKREKRKRGEKDEESYPIKVCDECLCAYPSTEDKCPLCGYVNEVKETTKKIDEDAELVEARAEELRLARLARKNWKKAKSYKELLDIGKARGYKPSWAAFKAAELKLTDTPSWVYRYLSKSPSQTNLDNWFG